MTIELMFSGRPLFSAASSRLTTSVASPTDSAVMSEATTGWISAGSFVSISVSIVTICVLPAMLGEIAWAMSA